MKKKKKPKQVAATVVVVWCDECHEVQLTPRQWKQVLAGQPVSVEGPGFHSDGEFFSDCWSFNYENKGSLIVSYGGDGGQAWVGDLESATIELPHERTGLKL
ncbi:MAG TPA: hypothetical protein VKY92_09855 [Verrucomicrobiae bacterium]|nr:hypothetical protein [Verrucomicrobiae bacterium]